MEFSPKVNFASNGVFVEQDFEEGEPICTWQESLGKCQEELLSEKQDLTVKHFMVFEDSYIPNIDLRSGKVF